MSKIYDDIFRTLCEKNTKLLIPVINEVFSTNYKITEETELLSGEHHILSGKKQTGIEEIITDLLIRLAGKIYHIECQSNPDGTIIIGSHWHVYREGYDRKFAFPATNIDDDDFISNTLQFFDKFHLIDKPNVNYQLEILP